MCVCLGAVIKMDSESVKKMLRSVLQSSKTGVPVSSLQSQYRSLCGEFIPLKKLGFSKLEDYLRSISSVVRLEHHMGEVRAQAQGLIVTSIFDKVLGQHLLHL